MTTESYSMSLDTCATRAALSVASRMWRVVFHAAQATRVHLAPDPTVSWVPISDDGAMVNITVSIDITGSDAMRAEFDREVKAGMARMAQEGGR